MGKNNKNKNKKTIKSEKPKERVTMEALAAMSDSDEEDVPKSQWNTKAKNLAQAIEDGKFDSLLEKMKGGDDDDAEIEEASLNSTSDVEEEDGDDDNGKEAQAAEEEEAESGSEEEEEEVADDQEQEQEEPEIEQDDGSENTDDEEEEEEEERPTVEDAKLKTLKANNTFNQKALAVVTAEQVAAHSKLPWAERFDIMPETPLPFGENGDPESNPLDVHDDLKREVAFYNTALEAVNLARKECQQAKVQFSRPEDFFAEMVKTDGKKIILLYVFDCSLLAILIISVPFFHSILLRRSHGQGQGQTYL
jgi:rRNA-processing protein EBP2